MRPLPSPRNARTRSAAAGSRDAIRGGLDRQLGGPMVAPDGHLNAALAEAGELLPYLGEALHGARRDCQLEPRPIARPQRILGDRLGGVRGEPTGPLEGAGRPSRGRSEEHTSELQSRFDLVCRLLLEKKNSNLDPASNILTTQHNFLLLRESLASAS